jgi:uncharacterized coiled-coil DUF342 family protein
MKDFVTVNLSKEHHELLQKLCKRDDIKYQKDYVESMLEYFDETGLSPTQKIKSVSSELSKLRNVLVGFIREQEKTKLDPLITQFNDLTEFLINYFKTKALTKDDLKGILIELDNTNKTPVISKNEEINVEAISETSLEDSGYKTKLNRAKTYFKEFLTHLKPSTFTGGFTIEKKTIMHYESIFEQLN